MKFYFLLATASIVSTSALADCRRIAEDFQKSTPRLEAIMGAYKDVPLSAATSKDRAALSSRAIAANGLVLGELGLRVQLLERGQSEGCFGKETTAWTKILTDLRQQFNAFKSEAATLSSADFQNEAKNKSTNGRTTIDAVNIQLDAQFASMNEKMPMKIDSLTSLKRVQRSNRLIAYIYELYLKKSTWTEAKQQAQRKNLLTSNCKNKDVKTMLALGYEYSYGYFDEDGLLLDNFVLSATACEQV